MKTPSPGQNLLGRAAQWLERATLVALGVTVGWCFLAIPSDLNGDPNDYLFIARSMLERGLAAEGLTAMRTPGYPAFVLIASGGLRSLNTVFLVQAVLYVASVRWFAVTFARGAAGRAALQLLAAVPMFAYLQKLLFPDGLIVTLGLATVTAVARERWRMAAVLAVGLTAVKPVFAFTFLLLAWCYWRKRWPDSRWRRPVAVGLIAGTPLAAAVALWALFPGVAYLTMLWRPVLAGVAVDTILPAHRETWRGPRGHEMEIDYARVREHARSPEHVVVWASPAGRGDEGRMPRGELEAAKRHVMAVMWKRAPGTHAHLAASLYIRALLGAGAASHANYMIGQKAGLMRSEDFTTAHYRATELVALPTADRLGGSFLEFVEQPANWFFALHRGSEAAMSVVPWGIGLALAALGVAGLRRGASDRDGPMAGAARRAALMWCHLYAVALAVAAQVLTDRYVVLPVLLLGGVLVGWVEAWWQRPDSAARGGPTQGKGGAEGPSKEDASG